MPRIVPGRSQRDGRVRTRDVLVALRERVCRLRRIAGQRVRGQHADRRGPLRNVRHALRREPSVLGRPVHGMFARDDRVRGRVRGLADKRASLRVMRDDVPDAAQHGRDVRGRRVPKRVHGGLRGLRRRSVQRLRNQSQHHQF